MIKRKCRIIIGFVVILLINLNTIIANAEQVDKTPKFIYFYSPTCMDCSKLQEYFDDLEGVEIIKYDVTDENGKASLNDYGEQYNVPTEDRMVPIVFVGDKFFIGSEEIINELEANLKYAIDYNYPELQNDNNFEEDISFVYSTGAFGVFVIGLINGLNPCSLAMVIFFITVLITGNVKRTKALTITFIVSKFITYLLLGTVLYNFLTYLDISKVQTVVVTIMLIFIGVLFVGNLSDYINIKNGHMNRVILQLPKKMRKFNQSLMKKAGEINNAKLLIAIIFVIGTLVSMTEFLCTGQVYMLSIVTIFQYVREQSLKAFFYLLIYNTGMVIPLIILGIIINRGKSILDVSEKVVENTAKIKMINMILLLILLAIIIIFNLF